MPSIRVRAGGNFFPDRSAGQGHCSFSEPSPHRAGRCHYLNLHQPDSHSLPHPGDSLRPNSNFEPIQAASSGFPHKWTCQQQSRIKYNRQVYTIHTVDIPQVPNLHGRGGCATEPSRIPPTLGETTNPGKHSSYI